MTGDFSQTRDDRLADEMERHEQTEMEDPIFLADRCPVCGWPFAEDASKGCVPGNCSYRPEQGTPEYERIRRRREELADPWSKGTVGLALKGNRFAILRILHEAQLHLMRPHPDDILTVSLDGDYQAILKLQTAERELVADFLVWKSLQ